MPLNVAVEPLKKMSYQFIPILIFLAIAMIGGLALIVDAGRRAYLERHK
jgi:hypothetical protein